MAARTGRSHSLSSVYTNFTALKRELGIGNALLAATNGALRKLHPRLGVARYYLIAQPIPQSGGNARNAGRIQVRQLLAGDPALGYQDRSPEEIRTRFESAGVCLAAFRGDEPAPLGFIWLLWAPYTETTHRCRLIPPEDGRSVLDVDIYIQPRERGGMTFMRLWQAANAYLRDRGITHSYSRISAYNGRSLRAHQRMGAEILGSQIFVEIGGLEFLLSNRRPYLSTIRPHGDAPDVPLPGV